VILLLIVSFLSLSTHINRLPPNHGLICDKLTITFNDLDFTVRTRGRGSSRTGPSS